MLESEDWKRQYGRTGLPILNLNQCLQELIEGDLTRCAGGGFSKLHPLTPTANEP